jgi:hypothetical protein
MVKAMNAIMAYTACMLPLIGTSARMRPRKTFWVSVVM